MLWRNARVPPCRKQHVPHCYWVLPCSPFEEVGLVVGRGLDGMWLLALIAAQELEPID